MKRLSLIGRMLLGGFLALALTTTSYGQTAGQTADVPKTISYQGLISTPEGRAIADGSYEITVTIYGDAEGRTVVWRNSYTTDVRGGLFNLYLGGAESPLPGAGALNRPLWVGTQVAGSGELRPLTPLSASPYALNVADGSVTSEKVNMDYVSEIRIDGQKVTGKGTVLNLESDENISLKYDAVTGSVKIGSATAATGTNDGEKGASAQTANHAWFSAGDIINVGTGAVIAPVATDFIGTLGPITFATRTNNQVIMRYQPNGILTPNVVGGNAANVVIAAPSTGSVIGGGGQNAVNFNLVNGDYDVIGGGNRNDIGTTLNSFDYSTIGGGDDNSIQNDYSTIGGGQTNRVISDWGTIGGGQINDVNANHGTVGGGFDNNIGTAANFGTIGGGRANAVNRINGTVGGGTSNNVNGDLGTVGGGGGNNANTLGSTIGGGQANNVNAPADNGTIGGGMGNMVNGMHGTVGGGMNNHANSDGNTIAGGQDNHIQLPFGAIGGGRNNNIDADYGVIGGGQDNHIMPTGINGTIGGGQVNMLDGDHGTIGGGMGNTLLTVAMFGTIGGGTGNFLDADNGTISGGANHNMVGPGSFSTIAGGQGHNIDAPYATVSGGQANSVNAAGAYGTISGGIANHIDVTRATVGGGENNHIIGGGMFSTIGGGLNNMIDRDRATVSGGENNHIIGAGTYSTISGGMSNHIDVDRATIGGGEINNIVAGGSFGTIGGGIANHIDVGRGTIGGGEANGVIGAGFFGTVGGGQANIVDIQHGTVGGGEGNRVTAAPYGTIPGGDNLNVANSYAQTAVGFFNAPRGAVPIRPAPGALTDDPLFMVGNGDFAGGVPVRTNAFEVSYNGHSVVFDINGSGGATIAPMPGRPSIPGATYIDNVIYAWADVPATPGPAGTVVTPNDDFGVSSIVKGALPGEYIVTINVVDPATGAVVVLNSASITATLVDDPLYSVTCGSIVTSRIGTFGPNTFKIQTFDMSGGFCTQDDLPFMFKVTGRP